MTKLIIENKPTEVISNQIPKEPTLKSKLPIILFVITLLFFFGFGGIFIGKYYSTNQSKISPSISPTFISNPTLVPTTISDVTTNWKEYSATDIYKISYPQNLYSIKNDIKSLKASWPGIITIYPTDSFNTKSPLSMTYKISIVIAENSKNLTMNQPEKLFGDGLIIQYSSSEYINKIKETTIDNLKAYRLDNIPFGSSGITTDIMTIKDNKIYEILVEPYTQSDVVTEANKQIFEQIISTFKFIQ